LSNQGTPAAIHGVLHHHQEVTSAGGPLAGGKAGAPTHDEIARLAYAHWERRGGPAGSPWEDWFRAERELKGRERQKS